MVSSVSGEDVLSAVELLVSLEGSVVWAGSVSSAGLVSSAFSTGSVVWVGSSFLVESSFFSAGSSGVAGSAGSAGSSFLGSEAGGVSFCSSVDSDGSVSSAGLSRTISSRPLSPSPSMTSASAWMLEDCSTRTTLRKTASTAFHFFIASRRFRFLPSRPSLIQTTSSVPGRLPKTPICLCIRSRDSFP